jgi:hypothetical protein
MNNSDRLQEIRERAEKATPGPWQHIEAADHFGNAEMWNAYSAWCNEHFQEEAWWERTPLNGVVIQGVWHNDSTAGYTIPALLDEEFIAASREDIPYLLQLVTEQQREIEGLKGLVDSYSEELDGIKAAYQI